MICEPTNLDDGTSGSVEIKHTHSARCGCPKGNKFFYDQVFSPGTQDDVFEDTKHLVQSALDGYNVTIFAFGQTGAGKTHTMYGQKGNEGVTPRTAMEIFDLIELSKDKLDA